MKIHLLETGKFKLDGGAMFGVVPKTIWQKTNPADANNMCTWSMRVLLIEHENKLILIDTGIGSKQNEKFFSHFYLHGDDSLVKSIRNAGYHESLVTDVVFTHLHFDHCGGGTVRNGDKILLQFPNANYWSNKSHWQWAINPNAREKASFLSENLLPIEQSGQLKFIERNKSPFEFLDFIFVDGHTESQMLPVFQVNQQKYVFVADLFPSLGHLPIPYVMSYDTRPLLTMNEKEQFLVKAVAENTILLFQHDPTNVACNLIQTDKGIRAKELFNKEELFL